jgi:regulator of nonsense transcripts 1
MYNERRLYIGGGPGVIPTANYGPIGSANPTDRRGGRGKGKFLSTCVE